MDKYLMLIRRFLNASFRLLMRNNWDPAICAEYNEILTRKGAGPLWYSIPRSPSPDVTYPVIQVPTISVFPQVWRIISVISISKNSTNHPKTRLPLPRSSSSSNHSSSSPLGRQQKRHINGFKLRWSTHSSQICNSPRQPQHNIQLFYPMPVYPIPRRKEPWRKACSDLLYCARSLMLLVSRAQEMQTGGGCTRYGRRIPPMKMKWKVEAWYICLDQLPVLNSGSSLPVKSGSQRPTIMICGAIHSNRQLRQPGPIMNRRYT